MLDINKKIKEVIAQHLKIDPLTISNDSCLVEDLGADSLDLYEMYIEVEEAFGLENTDLVDITY